MPIGTSKREQTEHIDEELGLEPEPSPQHMMLPRTEHWEYSTLCRACGKNNLTPTDMVEIDWFFDTMNGHKSKIRPRAGDGSVRKGEVNMVRYIRFVSKYPTLLEYVRNARSMHSEDLLATLYEKALEALAVKELEFEDTDDLGKLVERLGKLVNRRDKKSIHIDNMVIANKTDIDARRQTIQLELAQQLMANPTLRTAIEPLIQIKRDQERNAEP